MVELLLLLFSVHHEHNETLRQVAQRGKGLSITPDIQNSARRGPVQTHLTPVASPVLSRTVASITFTCPFQPACFAFCDLSAISRCEY